MLCDDVETFFSRNCQNWQQRNFRPWKLFPEIDIHSKVLKCDVQGNGCGLKLHNRGIMKTTGCKRQVRELHQVREKAEKSWITRRNCSGAPSLPRDCGPNTYKLISVLGHINLNRRLEAGQRGEGDIFSFSPTAITIMSVLLVFSLGDETARMMTRVPFSGQSNSIWSLVWQAVVHHRCGMEMFSQRGLITAKIMAISGTIGGQVGQIVWRSVVE